MDEKIKISKINVGELIFELPHPVYVNEKDLKMDKPILLAMLIMKELGWEQDTTLREIAIF